MKSQFPEKPHHTAREIFWALILGLIVFAFPTGQEGYNNHPNRGGTMDAELQKEFDRINVLLGKLDGAIQRLRLLANPLKNFPPNKKEGE